MSQDRLLPVRLSFIENVVIKGSSRPSYQLSYFAPGERPLPHGVHSIYSGNYCWYTDGAIEFISPTDIGNSAGSIGFTIIEATFVVISYKSTLSMICTNPCKPQSVLLDELLRLLCNAVAVPIAFNFIDGGPVYS